MKKTLVALLGLSLLVTSCSILTKNKERKIASDYSESVTAAEKDSRQRLSYFIYRYAGDTEMLKGAIENAANDGLYQMYAKNTGVPLTDEGVKNLVNSWRFLGDGVKPLTPLELTGEGMYYDFLASDELAMRIATKRLVEIFAQASVNFVKIHTALQYRKEWDRNYKPGFRENVFNDSYKLFVSNLAVLDEKLQDALNLCQSVACAKHVYDAQAELLHIGDMLNRKYEPEKSKKYHFNLTIQSALNKEAIRMLSENMPQKTNVDKLYRLALNIFIKPIFIDTDIGELIHQATTVDIPVELWAGIKVEPGFADLKNEIKVLQYSFTRLQYSIIHNVPLSHAPTAFDQAHTFGMLLTCKSDPDSKMGYMAVVYGKLNDLECTDKLYDAEITQKLWEKTLKDRPDTRIAVLAEYYLRHKFITKKEIEFKLQQRVKTNKYSAQVKIFGIGAGLMSQSTRVTILIGSIRPVYFFDKDGNENPGNWAGPMAGITSGGGVDLGVLLGVDGNAIGSVAIYAGAGFLGIGVYAGIGWLKISPLPEELPKKQTEYQSPGYYY